MNVEFLLEKLEPLMPKQVRQWRTVRNSADAEFKRLLDQEVVRQGERVFGDIRNSILLSLPPQKNSRGTLNLGTIQYGAPKWPLSLSESELLQNLAVFGRSGAGKTNVVFHLLEQLSTRKIPWLFLDWKRTARHLLPQLRNKTQIYTPGRSLSPMAFNPFIVPPGLESNVYVNHLVDVMSEAFTLGEGSRSVLQEALSSCYGDRENVTSIQEVIIRVESMPSAGRVGGWKNSAMRALNSIAFGELASTRMSQEEHARSLLQGQTIVELDGMADSTKRFLVPMLCLWLYSVKLTAPEREKLSMVIVVEEAHHVLYRNEQRTKETMMNRLLRQCRELGISIIVVDQHPHLISSAALGNTYTSICLNLKDPSDINRAAGLSGLADNEKRLFNQLPVGQGIVKLQDRWRKPTLVQFPLVDVAKGSVNDAMLKSYVLGKVSPRAIRKRIRAVGQNLQLGTGDRYLTEDEYLLLHDVSIHNNDGVKARYERLGWSGQRGQRVKDRLVQRGWLIETEQKLGRSRQLNLRLSAETESKMEFSRSGKPVASAVHDYWQRYYAAIMRDRGYDVTTEAPRHGGKVDVLAVKDGKRIGIEIETGKSDVVANVRNGLLEGFDEVVVDCTDEKSLQRMEHNLAMAQMLELPTVKTILQGSLSYDDHRPWPVALTFPRC